MGSVLKKFLSILLLFIILFFLFDKNQITFAAQIPQYVRIGLFFNSASIKTAINDFLISAENGVDVGWYVDGNFNIFYSSTDGTALKIKKDSSYYYEFNTGITSLAVGQAKATEFTTLGLKAFVAINSNNNWVILIGGYADKTTAEADKVNIEKKLSGAKLTLLNPSAKMVVIENIYGQTINGFFSDSNNLTIRSSNLNDFKVVKVNTTAYRGEIEVIRQQGSDMTVVNIIDLEQYLYGVVPVEIEGSSPNEALKAQSIAARTYTVNNLNKYISLGFNLCNTNNSQVYNGFSKEVLAASKAVDDTVGQILMYNGKPAEIFYFSSSGGVTEDVKNVWGSTSYPYLTSVEDKYETPTTTNYIWNKTFTFEQVKNKVSKDIGNVIKLQVTKRSPAGRVTELIIKGTKDQAVYKLESARTVLSLPSQWYNIDTGSIVSTGVIGNTTTQNPSALKIITSSGIVNSPKTGISVIGKDKTIKSYSTSSSGSITISGKGWGHAVGMSQNGAIGMARAGFTYKEILEHYFNGAKVQKVI